MGRHLKQAASKNIKICDNDAEGTDREERIKVGMVVQFSLLKPCYEYELKNKKIVIRNVNPSKPNQTPEPHPSPFLGK